MHKKFLQPSEKVKKFFQAGFLLLLLAIQHIIVFHPSTALAQETPTYSGPEESIRRFLPNCTPTEPTDAGKDAVDAGGFIGQIGNNPVQSANVNNARNDLYSCFQTLFRFAFVAAGITAVFMIVWAGYLYMVDSGNGAQKKAAKKLITSILTGILLLGCTFIFLRFINPDILVFRTFQVSEITGGTEPGSVFGGQAVRDPTKAGGYGDGSGPANHSASELVGCGFQGNKANYVKYMTENLFQATKSICAAAKAKGFSPQISSISTGSHAANSFHYRGCAVDFAGGDPNYVNHPIGQAVIEAAKAYGNLRINPGTDAHQTFHVHIDVGANGCTAPTLPSSATK